MRRWRLVAAWVVAAVAATTVTWQIVSLADDRVGESDTAPLNVSTPSSPATGPTTTGPHGSSSSSTSSPPSSSSSTTPSSSSSTSVASKGELLTVPTAGGNVTVRVSPGSVTYVSALPAPGFVVEVEDAGPPDVRVELVSTATVFEIRVRWRDGDVRIEVERD